MCLCAAWPGCKELLRKWFCYITLQIGFMNNGVIKAADVEYYVNGGCTLDESETVNKKCAIPVGYQLRMAHTCVILYLHRYLSCKLDKFCEEFVLEIKFG